MTWAAAGAYLFVVWGLWLEVRVDLRDQHACMSTNVLRDRSLAVSETDTAAEKRMI